MFRKVKYNGMWHVAEECFAKGRGKTTIHYFLVAGHIITLDMLDEIGDYVDDCLTNKINWNE